jgi:protein-S-isoprenylcysteine O-methyltransferase Ste14
VLKTLSFFGVLGMAGGVLAQFATGNLLSYSPWVIAAQAGAFALLLWARLTFGRRSFHAVANPTEGGLVTTGPYRYIRHPIYTSITVISAAGAVAHWSWESALLALFVLGTALLRIFCEEAMVTARYPEYRQYASHTRRMIPYLF